VNLDTARAVLADADWRPTIRTAGCDNSGGSCVDIAELSDGGVATRNPGNPASITVWTPADWAEFLRKAAAGQLPRGAI